MDRPDPPTLEYATPEPAGRNARRLLAAVLCAVMTNLLVFLICMGFRDTGVVLGRSFVASAIFWLACLLYLLVRRLQITERAALLISYGFPAFALVVQYAWHRLH
jgi:hypothetical protein